MDIIEQDFEMIHAQATLILQTLLQGNNPELWQQTALEWLPRKEDFELAFTEGAEEAHDNYYRLWQHVPVPLPKKGQTRLLIWSSIPEHIPATQRFPGGYNSIIDRLNPNTVWFSWKYTHPDESLGMAYNGLVWLGDRFRLFPKPWRLW